MTTAVTAGLCASCQLPEADHKAADPQAASILMALAGCSGFRVSVGEAHAGGATPAAVRPPDMTWPPGGEPDMAELDIATLAAAAAESRRGEPGWDEDAWTGALIATQHADPPWPVVRTWLAVVHEISDPNGHPRNLIEAVRDPVRQGGGRRDEDAIARIAAEAKARAEEARIRGQERKRGAA